MEVRPGYKQTEIGVFPEEWKVSYLSQVSLKITDGDHATPRRSRHGYYLLSARNVLNGRLDVSDVDYVDAAEYQRMRQRCSPEPGDILISCSGTIGRVAVIPPDFECVLVRSAALVKLDRSVACSEFIQYWLQGHKAQGQIANSVNQGAQPNLFLNYIERLQCANPRLFEQRAIAAALSDVDALLVALDRLIAKKRDLKQAAMQQLLTGQARLPGFQKMFGYQDTSVGLIPKDWTVEELVQISKVPLQNGLFFKPTHKGRGIRLINVGDLYVDGTIDLSSLELFDATDKDRQRYRVEDGDIFFTRSSVVPAGIAHCNIIENTNEQAVVFDSHVIRFRADTTKGKPTYLNRYFKGPVARRHLVAGAKTLAMTTIDQVVLNKCPVILPSLEEQTAIAAVLSDMDAEIDALKARRAKTRDLKQAMMQELLTGKIRLVSTEASHA